MQHPAALLDLQNVREMRGQKVVLDGISLRVQLNEHVAVLGPNGCGKSTLIKTITRECYPVVREGSSMTIFGQRNWNVFELRSLLGIVSNDLMSSCTSDASGLDVVLSAFSAARASSRTIRSIPNTESWPRRLCSNWGSLISASEPCRKCRRERLSAS